MRLVSILHRMPMLIKILDILDHMVLMLLSLSNKLNTHGTMALKPVPVGQEPYLWARLINSLILASKNDVISWNEDCKRILKEALNLLQKTAISEFGEVGGT